MIKGEYKKLRNKLEKIEKIVDDCNNGTINCNQSFLQIKDIIDIEENNMNEDRIKEAVWKVFPFICFDRFDPFNDSTCLIIELSCCYKNKYIHQNIKISNEAIRIATPNELNELTIKTIQKILDYFSHQFIKIK